MKYKQCLITLMVIILLSCNSNSQKDNDESRINTQSEMTRNARHEAEMSAEKLERLLQDLQPSLDNQDWEELVEIQADWKSFVSRDCRWQRNLLDSGSVAPQIYWNCINDHTIQRINQLKILLCEGRGMTGPCEESQKY